MSYNIHQLVYSSYTNKEDFVIMLNKIDPEVNINETTINNPYQITTIQTSSDEDSSDSNSDEDSSYSKKIFKDVAIKRNDSSKFSSKNTYYFKGTLQPGSKNQLFSNIEIIVKLSNGAGSSSTQFIDSFSIPGNGNGGKTVEFFFTPQVDYTYLVFEIRRTYLDYLFTDGISINITGESLCKINNILQSAITIKKLGIQGKPGLKMVINQEGFWMNPTGIFEINDDYNIDFLGFVITSDNKSDVLTQPILIDYLTQNN